jgi:hypothetical protein
MTKDSIKDLLDNSNIAQELKEAYSFMLLSRGYSNDDIKILDDYAFIVRKKDLGDNNQEENIETKGDKLLRNRKKRNIPKNLVCLTSKSESYNKRDHTLYSLNGSEPLTKGRLIWSIISLYQRDYSPTYGEVEQLYNHKLNLLRRTVIDIDSLDALRADKQKRFYYHEVDLLESIDGIKYAVSNQWSVDKMDVIICFARSKGWTVEVIIPQKMVE